MRALEPAIQVCPVAAKMPETTPFTALSMAASAKTMLADGGKSANIVFADAAIDNAVKGVVSGIFAATGQTCIAGSRALIQRSIHDQFVDKLVTLAKTARMGDPALDTTQVGPIT